MKKILCFFIFINFYQSGYSVPVSARLLTHHFVNYSGEYILTDSSVSASSYQTPYSEYEAEEEFHLSSSGIHLGITYGLGIGTSTSTFSTSESISSQDEYLTVSATDKTSFAEISYTFSIDNPKLKEQGISAIMVYVGAVTSGEFEAEIVYSNLTYDLKISDEIEPTNINGTSGGLIIVYLLSPEQSSSLEILIGARGENLVYEFDDFSYNRSRSMLTLGLGVSF